MKWNIVIQNKIITTSTPLKKQKAVLKQKQKKPMASILYFIDTEKLAGAHSLLIIVV